MSDIDDFQRSQARSRRVRFGLLALVLASPFLWLGWNCHKRNAQNEEWRDEARKRNAITPREQTELADMVKDNRARIAEAIKAFPAEVAPAKLEALRPGAGGCPANLKALDPSSDAYLAYGGGIQTVKPGATPKPEDMTSALGELDKLSTDMKTDEDGPNRAHVDRADDLAERGGYEVFVVGERTDAVVLANEYVPGRVRGTAYVYAAALKKVICAADVDVENASEVNVEYTTSSYDVTGQGNKREAAAGELNRDLGVRLRKAVRASLRAVQ